MCVPADLCGDEAGKERVREKERKGAHTLCTALRSAEGGDTREGAEGSRCKYVLIGWEIITH